MKKGQEDMKNMKKILALVVAALLVVASMSVAFADTTYSITLTNSDQKGTHTYSAYKILSGSLASVTVNETTVTQLQNIDWALTPVQANALLAILKADATFGEGESNSFYAIPEVTDANSNQTAVKFAQVMNGESDNSAKAKALAQALGTVVANNGVTVAGTSTTNAAANATTATYTISGLAQGYYFVQDTGTIADGDSSSRYILAVVGDVTVTAKSDTVSVDKKVDDADDSTTGEEAIAWQDSADYDINDVIPYKITGTLPSTYEDYEWFSYTFTDTMSKGLTYNNDAKVYVSVGDNWYDVTTEFTISTADGENESTVLTVADGITKSGTTFTKKGIKDITTGKAVTVPAEKSFDTMTQTELASATAADPSEITITAASTFVVRYSATLNSDAVMGVTGNPNTVTITFSNNPNKDHDGDTGTTPGDTVTVFSFNLNVDKVDENGDALKGAGFTLYKYNKDSEADDKYVAVGSEVKGAELTSFQWQGLDAGKYKLVETTVPEGYNKATDITFDVVATHSTTSDNPELQTLTVTNIQPTAASMSASKAASGTADVYTQATEYVSGTTYYTKDGDTYTQATVADATAFADGTFYIKTTVNIKANIETTVINQSGTQLPSTGGIGTTIFYVGGSVLVLLAVVLLVTKRRMNTND